MSIAPEPPGPVFPASQGTFVGGLVSDPTGATDNTAALTAANAASRLLLIAPGVYPCDWTPLAGTVVRSLGQRGNPSYAGTVKFIGLASMSGTQICPIHRTNPSVRLEGVTVDGGGAAGQAWSCLYGLYDNIDDCSHDDLFVTGGVLVSWFQDAACKRPTGGKVRVSSSYGGSTSNPNKVQRAIAGDAATVGLTLVAGSTAATLDGTTNSWITGGWSHASGTYTTGVPGDAQRGIIAAGLLQGTWITDVIDDTHVTLSQPALSNQTLISCSIVQGEASWLNGTDNELEELRSTNGTTRFGGGGGNQLTVAHCTYTAGTNIGQPGATFEQGSWNITNFYSDSSPVGSTNIAHTRGAKQIVIGNLTPFQNSGNSNPAITENDTANSLTISGGGFFNKSGTGAVFSTAVALASGNNPAFTWRGSPYGSTNSLATAGGLPVMVTGGVTGAFELNFAGTPYGVGVKGYATPAAPAATVATTPGVMAGLAVAFTPAATGKMRLRIIGVCSTSTAAANIGITGKYGTGAAPANGAAVAGTSFADGNKVIRCAVAGNGAGTPFEVVAVVAGLTPGVAAWMDLAFYTANAADAANIYQLAAEFEEVP